jgi:hypothetical protein
MGQWVTTTFSFGIDLGEKIPKNLYITDDHDAEYETHNGDIGNFLAAWEKFKGENFDFPFDIITYKSYQFEDARYFLAYKPTIQKGWSDKPCWIKTPEFDVELVKKMIQDFGFKSDSEDNHEPAFAIVSLYG